MGRRLVLGTIAMVVGIALAAAGLVGAPGTDAIWIGAGAVIWVVTTAVLAPVVGQPVLLRVPRRVRPRSSAPPGRLAGRERPAQPAAYGRHRLGADDRPRRRLGRRRARLVAQRDQGRDRRRRSSRATSSSRCRRSRASRRSTATRWRRSTASTWSRASRARRSASTSTASPTRPSPIGVDPAFFEIYDLTMVDGTDQISGRPGAPQRGPRRRPEGRAPATRIDVEFPGGKTIPLEVAGVFEDTPSTGGITVPLVGPRARPASSAATPRSASTSPTVPTATRSSRTSRTW